MQRMIEAAGFTTISLTPVPDLTASVSVPRIAAIEYPLGRTLGQPGDTAGQMAVFRATFHALKRIDMSGGVIHLPFEWPESPKEVRSQERSVEPPPIAQHLQRHIWQLPRLLKRDVPDG
ncbi:MAG: hypothetical protein GY759_10130 [Chloroflexi bacterium]|nr:hypothetical protein [Chloroflexota bacterium]